ncbi:hypothetical protein PSFL111601_05405 [Pseudomonas floridensis]
MSSGWLWNRPPAGCHSRMIDLHAASWIPKGMAVEYLSKAKTGVRAVADGTGVEWKTAGDKIVPVDIFDEGGVKVVAARITTNVKTAWG